MARGDTANRCYCIYFAPEATNIVRRVAYKCPEFGAFTTRLPYFHMRYPADAKGPFDVQVLVEAQDGTRVKKTITVPWNPNPIGKPFPNDRILLGTVAYGPGLELYIMLAKEFPGARRELGEVWKNLLAERAADVPRTVALERGGGDDELRFFTAAAYRDKVYLMNLDMHATRKVTAVVKGRKIAAALKPLEVKEIGL